MAIEGVSRKKLERENAQLKERLRVARRASFAQNAAKVLLAAIKYTALVVCVYYTADASQKAIIGLSGKTTSADIKVQGGFQGNVDVNTDVKLSGADKVLQAVTIGAILFGLGGMVYGMRQAKLRRDVIARFHPLQEAAEKAIDPSRSSSRLTKSGDTRPEDK